MCIPSCLRGYLSCNRWFNSESKDKVFDPLDEKNYGEEIKTDETALSPTPSPVELLEFHSISHETFHYDISCDTTHGSFYVSGFHNRVHQNFFTNFQKDLLLKIFQVKSCIKKQYAIIPEEVKRTLLELRQHFAKALREIKKIELFDPHLKNLHPRYYLHNYKIELFFQSIRPCDILEHLDDIEEHLEELREMLCGNAQIPSLHDLIIQYDQFWKEELGEFSLFDFDELGFIRILAEYNTRFPILHSLICHEGYIEKLILDKKTKIFVRADLHGDLKSLIENIKSLQDEGLLDQNFRCTSNVILVFLGDYADRGAHSLEVLQILMKLKLENPQQVILIRGNHEDVQINYCYSGLDRRFLDFIQSKEKSDLLEEFYLSMPLCCFIGQKNNDNEIDYVMFSHGLFEIHVDPYDMLNNLEKRQIMFIFKAPIGTEDGVYSQISYRIKSIEAHPDIDYLSLIRKASSISEIGTLRLKHVAQKIERIAKEDIRNHSYLKTNAYTWGDVNPAGRRSFTHSLEKRMWKISPEDIRAYFTLISSDKARVSMLFRGHEHKHQHHFVDEELVITTLPVGMDSPLKEHFPGQPDTVYILETKASVKEWTKQSILRKTGVSEKSKSSKTRLYCKKV